MGALGALLLACAPLAQAEEALVIGSKRFTESYILGELLARTAGSAGPAVHKPGLGNTGILVEALRSGAIDVYPEYSGTIAREILKREDRPELAEINRALARRGLAASVPLGFENSYALGVREVLAHKLGLRRISDLAGHPTLKAGLSQEFLARRDGWPGLARAYGLTAMKPVSLDHGLAYEALAQFRIDLMDLYTTDAKISRYGIRVLEDDRRYFPSYAALLLHRADAPQRHAAQWRALQVLEGRIDATRMRAMNAAAELEGRSFAQAAVLFDAPPDNAAPEASVGKTPAGRSLVDALFADDLWRLTREHLVLVFGALLASVLAGVPLGVVAAARPRLAQPIFAAVGVIQTIPSLALLAFLIAAMGRIGLVPAALALFLYGLLPIVRGTHAGLLGVGAGVKQAALALGLTPRQRLWLVELPLARLPLLAGVKTSAVINVGTATIAAFVGAGGYGERIASGLALNDATLLVAGALPAAALALALQALFEWLERRLPGGPPRSGSA